MKKQEEVEDIAYKGVTATWISTLLLASFHIFTSFKLTVLSCERYLVVYNATCAGILLLFGSVTSVAASLGIPLKILGDILEKARIASIRDNHYMDLLVVLGVITFTVLCAFTPLLGFYKAVSASRFRDLKSVYYYSTVALSCLDIFFMSFITWALIRRRDIKSFFTKVEYNSIKSRLKKT